MASAEVVDISFTLRGDTVPHDHAYDLYRALLGWLDWLESDADAAVHPIRGTASASGEIFLGHRARLALRLDSARADQALALSGAHLDVGSGLQVGAGRVQALKPWATLYTDFFSSGAADEADLLRDAGRLLAQSGVSCGMLCGRRRSALTPHGEIRGASLLLQGLAPEHSLAVQRAGLGEGRKLGCGIFVPHKSAAAVGS